MKKLIVIALAAASCALAAGAAEARSNVAWSIGVNLPPIGVAVGDGPVYAEPAYYPAYPAYADYPAYATYPVYAPRPYYRPAPFYAPAPVVYGRSWDRDGRQGRDGRNWQDGNGRGDDGRHDADRDGSRRGQPVPRDDRRGRHD